MSERLMNELLSLRADQANWRKGVGLIASALGDHRPVDLCCVRIANAALSLRAEVERLRKVEQAAREFLADTVEYLQCCRTRCMLGLEHHPDCTQAKLAAALDAKQEGSKP